MTSLWIPGPWISGPGMVEPSDIWTFGLPDVSGLLDFWIHMNYRGIGSVPCHCCLRSSLLLLQRVVRAWIYGSETTGA
jgi:hypothetical protein